MIPFDLMALLSNAPAAAGGGGGWAAGTTVVPQGAFFSQNLNGGIAGVNGPQAMKTLADGLSGASAGGGKGLGGFAAGAQSQAPASPQIPTAPVPQAGSGDPAYDQQLKMWIDGLKARHHTGAS